MDATDWFYVIAFSIGLWVLIPRVVRQAIVIERDRLWAWLWPLCWAGLVAFERVAFRLVTGRKRLTPARTQPDGERPDRTADRQTDRQTDRAAADLWESSLLELDRTRAAVVRVLVAAGWSVAEIRAVMKGDNNVISQEIAAARDLSALPPAPARPEWVSERDQRLMEEVGR